MKRRVVCSETARAEYVAAIRYIAERNPGAAEHVAERIEEMAALLVEFATGRPGRAHGTYEKVVSGLPCVLAYEIVSRPEGGETVAILHVIHGARHWQEGEWPEP